MTSSTSLPFAAASGRPASTARAWRRALAGWLRLAADRLARADRAPVLHAADAVPLRWHSPAPARLAVACGMLWVTRDGAAEDHWLAAGETLDVPAGATLRIGADPTAPDVPARWHWIPLP